MRSMIFAAVLLAISMNRVPAHAEDAATFAASLETEEDECEYLRNICARIDRAKEAARAADARAERARSAGRADADMLALESAQAGMLALAPYYDLGAAQEAIKKKHKGRLPKCFRTCIPK